MPHMSFNKDFAKELSGYLKDLPRSFKFNLGTYIEVGVQHWEKDNPWCETVGCIAGSAVYLTEKENHDAVVNMGVLAIHNTARDLLGLNSKESDNLFMPGHFLYDHAEAENAARVLDAMCAANPGGPPLGEVIRQAWNQEALSICNDKKIPPEDIKEYLPFSMSEDIPLEGLPEVTP